LNIEETGDASGQEIQLLNLVPSLKANLGAAQEKKTEYVKVSYGSSDISWGSLRQLGQLQDSWGSSKTARRKNHLTLMSL
jgi:hypothetical protein